jgi:ferredoxin
MLDLRVDADKCIRCGECAADCPYLCIALDGGTGDGLPAAVPGREIQCIDCGHCLAVCPTGALSVMGLTGPAAPGGACDPEAWKPGHGAAQRACYKRHPVAPRCWTAGWPGATRHGVNNRACN